MKFDDTELKCIDEDDFYSNISLVSQNVFLFNDTLKNNVCLYNDYSKSDFERSIEKSKLNSVIEDLEEKREYSSWRIWHITFGWRKAKS